MKELLYVLAVPSTTIVGLFALTSWWSALLYFSAIVLVAVYVIIRGEKHRHIRVFDDKLSDERIERAREWLLDD